MSVPVLIPIHDAAAFKEQLMTLEGSYREIMEDLLKGRDLPKGTIQTHLLTLATGSPEDAELALAAILHALHANLLQKMRSQSPALAKKIATFEMLAAFDFAVKQSRLHLIPALREMVPPIERLYHLKPLEAVIFQPASTEIINGVSFKTALTIDKAAAKQPEGSATAIQVLSLYQNAALNRETAESWLLFIQDLERNNPRLMRPLFEMMKTLDVLNLTGIWMGLVFNEKPLPATSEELFNRMQAQFDQNRVAFNWMQEQLALLGSCEKMAAQFADPDFYHKNQGRLQAVFSKWFVPVDNAPLKQHYDQADSLGKLALLQLMGRMVGTYDKAIKAVTGSPQFGEQAKLAAFAELLGPYEKMMESCVYLIPENQRPKVLCAGYVFLSTSQETINKNSISTLQYIERILSGRKRKPKENEQVSSRSFQSLVTNAKEGRGDHHQLEARSEFSVQPLLLGSKSDVALNITWPERLEEYFTFFHQTMETVKDRLITEQGLSADLLDPHVQERVDAISKTFRVPVSQITMSEGKVKVSFNVPLRQHSAVLSLTYDAQDPQKGVDFTVSAFGNNEHNRWAQLAAALNLLSQVKGISFSEAPKIDYQDPKGAEATFHIDPDCTQFRKMVDCLEWCLDKMTMGATASGEALGHIQQLGIDLQKLDPKCLTLCLGLSSGLMEKALDASKNGNPESVQFAKMVALETIQFILDHRLDYKEENVGAFRYLLTTAKGSKKECRIVYPLASALTTLHELAVRGLIPKEEFEAVFFNEKVRDHDPKFIKELAKFLELDSPQVLEFLEKAPDFSNF